MPEQAYLGKGSTAGKQPTSRALHKGTTGIPAATEHKTYRKMKTQDRISGNVAKWAGGRHADNGGKARQLMAVRIPPNEMTGIQCREMDIQRGRNTGENRTYGEAGIPARTGHTQETENRKSPTLQKRGSRFCFLFSVYSDYVAFIIASRCLSLQATFI